MSAVHPLSQAVPSGQAVGDLQRGQGQGHQRGNVVTDRKPERAPLPHLSDRSDEHAARAGDRVLHLAAGCHDVQDRRANRSSVDLVVCGAVNPGKLAIRGRIEVQGLDVNAHLVRPDLRRGVQALGSLGQRDLVSRWLENPMQAHG